MAKNPIKIMASGLTGEIYAGRVNIKTRKFVGEKEIVTPSALSAVFEHLLLEKCTYTYEEDGVEYVLGIKKSKSE